MARLDGVADPARDLSLMARTQYSDAELLEARLRDAIEKCRKGSVALLPFLTPGEHIRAERLLRGFGVYGQAWFFGGYSGAERVCLYLLPEYLTEMLSAAPSECPTEEMRELLCEELSESVTAICIHGSGFRKLTHRDFLGAVLGLGIQRDAVGDLAVQDDHTAVLFCSRTIAELLRSDLVKVGSDTVKCAEYTVGEDFTDGRRYAPVSDTVASERLDCVVAALCNLSRDAAQGAIRAGLVEVDYETVERNDLLLSPPTTLSVRGHGKFILRTFDGETRKGRLRLRADRLI